MSNIITKSKRLYAKVIKNHDLQTLSSLYIHDDISTFDAIKDAFDDNKINKQKLIEILQYRIHYYKDVKLSKRKPFSRFLIFDKDTDQCVGIFGFDRMNIEDKIYRTSKNAQKYTLSRKSILISYKIHPHHCNKGFGTEIVTQMIKWFFKNFTHTKILAHLYKNNIPSQRLLEKVGFEKIYEVKYLNSLEPNTDIVGLSNENFIIK
jgi:predicted acetyltransferase